MKEVSAEIWRHPLVMGAIALTAVIAIASGVYYIVSTRLPSSQYAIATTGSIEEAVTGSGTVEPAQNPDLGFVSGGRVVRVNVSVGDKVTAGQTLASLDIATLAAQRANAQANLASQEANLSQLKSGPRAVDTQPKQTAVDQANQTLQNAYANVPTTITKAYNQSLSGISTYTDSLFNQPNAQTPTLAFNTTNSQDSSAAISGRIQANNIVQLSSAANVALANETSPQILDAGIATAITNLQTLQNYTSSLLSALNGAVPSGNFSQSSITSAQVSVGAMRDTINSQILSLKGVQQLLASDKLSVKSAQDALNLTVAGATSQSIDAQQAQVDGAAANVALYNAQIANAIITAPFSGTVSSVRIKPGDIAAPNSSAISLNPLGALQISVYLSEVDATKVIVGSKATVTLDAYGATQPFEATVATIDHSPTDKDGIPSYKATLQFSNADSRITSGMTANVTIIAAQKDGALIIPKSAVIQNSGGSFVLVQNGNTTVERQIQVGIESTTTVEVLSGLSAGDRFVTNSN